MLKWLILHLKNPQNWFHVKSKRFPHLWVHLYTSKVYLKCLQWGFQFQELLDLKHCICLSKNLIFPRKTLEEFVFTGLVTSNIQCWVWGQKILSFPPFTFTLLLIYEESAKHTKRFMSWDRTLRILYSERHKKLPNDIRTLYFHGV